MTTDPYYRSSEWRALRAAILKRDQICRTPGCGRPSQHVDHIIPRRRGGPDDLTNLRGLCPGCHARATRQGNSKPLRAVGCHEDGTPRDPWHWWNNS